jgi:hypothetical protein
LDNRTVCGNSGDAHCAIVACPMPIRECALVTSVMTRPESQQDHSTACSVSRGFDRRLVDKGIDRPRRFTVNPVAHLSAGKLLTFVTSAAVSNRLPDTPAQNAHNSISSCSPKPAAPEPAPGTPAAAALVIAAYMPP